MNGLNRSGTAFTLRWFPLLFILVLLGVAPESNAGSPPDLQSRINALQSTVTQLTLDVSALLTKFHMANVGDCGLLVGDVVAGSTGTTVSVPLTFIPGPTPISAIQGDVFLPAGWSITGITAGPAATASGKTVSFSSSTAIIFGLNQTPIPPGVLAIAGVRPASSAKKGLYPFELHNAAASDPNGASAPLCTTSGEIKL